MAKTHRMFYTKRVMNAAVQAGSTYSEVIEHEVAMKSKYVLAFDSLVAFKSIAY